ncbi:hypothetical protein DER46DRAFT_588612 [Fusarium sp. MPI-SDFR-AT-0072]|nr:hypothetical protein DER46DRAFT_588612 [Fusarium sp. MPI-SDFR-AT-0072]
MATPVRGLLQAWPCVCHQALLWSQALLTSSPPAPSNSESVPNRISSMATETPSTNSQYKGYEESHDDRLPAAPSQMGMTDHGSRTYLSPDQLTQQTKLLATH